MAKKKPSNTEPEPVSKRLELIKQAMERLPSKRTGILCQGCFAPDNTLTVTPHVEKMWRKEQLKLFFKEKGDHGVFLPCQFCKLERYLSLGGFSYDTLTADMKNCGLFVLLRDPRKNKEGNVIAGQYYKALVGLPQDETATINFEEWS